MVKKVIFMFSSDLTKFYENPKIASPKIAMEKDGMAKKGFFSENGLRKLKKYS